MLGGAYASGFRTALQRWPFVLITFAITLGTGLIFAAAAWAWLSLALDASVATRTLLTDLDMNVFVDLYTYHREGLFMLLVGGGVLAVVVALLWVWLTAATVVAVGEQSGVGNCLRRGLEFYSAYLGLAVLAAIMHAASVAAAYAVGHGLIRWTAESPSEMTYYLALAVGGALGVGLLLFSTSVHDHARIHCVATASGALRAYGWALGYVGWRERRALPLAIVLGATGSAAWVVYQTVGMLVPAQSSAGVLLSLVWGEIFLLGRAVLRVWFFAAASELQSSSEGTRF